MVVINGIKSGAEPKCELSPKRPPGEARLPAVAGVSRAGPVRLQNQQARYTSGARKALSLTKFCRLSVCARPCGHLVVIA